MLNSKSIGDKIATARKKTNISQAELGRRVSISPQAVGKLERGESMPDIITLYRIAEILNVDLNYFSDDFHIEKDETITIANSETSFNESTKPKKRSQVGICQNKI